MAGYSIVEIQAPKNEETEEDYSGKVNEAFNTKVILMLRLLRVKLNIRKYFRTISKTIYVICREKRIKTKKKLLSSKYILLISINSGFKCIAF